MSTNPNRFAVDTSSFAATAPLLDDGYYAGQLINVSTKRGQNDTITYVEKKEYQKGSREGVPTGEFVLRGSINFGAVLTSKKAIKTLQRDEPKVFNGSISLKFDDKTFILQPNHVLKSWLDALGIGGEDFSQSVDWQWDDNIEVPEELSHLSYAVDLLNAVTYYRAYFDLVCQAAVNIPVKVAVKRQPNYKNKEVEENVINCGNSFQPFCGIISYVDGAENDLED